MDLISISILLFTFFMVIACAFISLQILTMVRRQSNSFHLFKGQFIYLNERIDTLENEIGKIEKSQNAALDLTKTDLAERIKTARQETLRENDDIKFLLQQMRNPKKSQNSG